MTTSDPEQKWLNREWLPLKRIVNVARGANPAEDLSNLPPDWAAIFTDLKAYVKRGEIESISHPLEAFVMVRAHGFWKFLSREHVPDGLRKAWLVAQAFCHQWAQNHGIDLSVEPSDKALITGLTQEAMSRGGKAEKHCKGFQNLVDTVRVKLDEKLTHGKFLRFLREEIAEFGDADGSWSPHPPIKGCSDIYVDVDDTVFWEEDDENQTRNVSLKSGSLREYINRANKRH